MTQTTLPPESTPQPRKRYGLRIFVAFVVMVLILIAGSIWVSIWYISSPPFAEKVRLRVIAELEDATGGRVELKAFHWNVRALAFEADDLTIHGLEAPWDVPYAHVDRLYVQLKVIALIHPQVALRLLEVEHPVVHLIVYPDGSTNQPKPRRASGDPQQTINTIFDLKAERATVDNGLFIFNQESVPFHLAANKVNVVVQYMAPSDRYSATLDIADITTRLEKQPTVHSQLQGTLLLGRDVALVQELTWHTSRSHLEIKGELAHYLTPRFQLQAHGVVDLRDAAYLTGAYQLVGGVTDLDMTASGHSLADLLATGSVHLRQGAYHDPQFQIQDTELETPFRITGTEILASDVTAHAAGGIITHGRFRFTNWLNQAAAIDGKHFREADEPRAEFGADLQGVVVPQVLRSLLSRRYSELGFNAAVTGRGEGGWRSNPRWVELTARVNLSPLQGPEGVPTSGSVDATYHGINDFIEVRNVFVKTPGSTVQAQGLLDVGLHNSHTGLNVTVISTNLAEFDRVLATLGFASNSPSPSRTLPVQLHGQAEFRGKLQGPLDLLRATGHLDVSSFDTLLRPDSNEQPRQLQWDALHTDLDVSPQSIGVSNLTLVRGPTLLHASGKLTADPQAHGDYEFDEHSGIRGTVEIHHASLTDLETMAGQQELPITGTLTFLAHVNGQLDNLQGAGRLEVQGGTIAGEPYHGLTADLTGNRSEIGVAHLLFSQDGGRIDGSGGYDLQTHALHADLTGSRFQLAHITRLQQGRQPLDGALTFHLQAAGPATEPDISGNLELKNVTLGKQALGSVAGTLHTTAHTLFVDAISDLLHSHTDLHGQIEMQGDFPAQAKLTMQGTDVQQLLAIYAPQVSGGRSAVSGIVTLAGPLKTPKALDVDAALDKFELTYAPFTFANQGPLTLSMKHGILKVDSFHITGPETDLTAHGSADLYGKRTLSMQMMGSVNLKLAQSFNNNVISSGHAGLSMNATGSIDTPRLTGQVTVQNGNFAYLEFPSGISNMNGTLEFNEDRLEVRKLTAETGGGTVVMGGFLTYKRGIYVDLTAKAKDVRVRYPQGISSTADASLHLVGSPQQATLSGNILLTRFGITGNLGLTSSGAVVTAPPDPAALSSHVLLDIHLTSSPQLSFENSYATLAGLVDLRIRGSVAAPSVLGRVSITQGSANFAGTDYQLQRGEIYFTNPVRIDPVIDVDASASVRDYDISLGVHGTLEKLNTTYRSEPPLAQADIIALLALGRTQEQAQIYQQEQASAGIDSTTNALLGGALNATVSNRVQKLFGVGQVKIDPNYTGSFGQSTPRVTVTQQISKAVTLTYATNVNETSQQLIQAQIALTRDVSLVAVRDEAGVFSLLVRVRQRKR